MFKPNSYRGAFIHKLMSEALYYYGLLDHGYNESYT